MLCNSLMICSFHKILWVLCLLQKNTALLQTYLLSLKLFFFPILHDHSDLLNNVEQRLVQVARFIKII